MGHSNKIIVLTSYIPDSKPLVQRADYRQALIEQKSQTHKMKQKMGVDENSKRTTPLQLTFWLGCWSSIGATFDESLLVGRIIDFFHEEDISPESAIEHGLALDYISITDPDRPGESASGRLTHRRDSEISLADPVERPDLYVNNRALRDFSTHEPWRNIFRQNHSAPTDTIPFSDVVSGLELEGPGYLGDIYAERREISDDIKKIVARALIAIGENAGILRVKDAEAEIEITTKRVPTLKTFDELGDWPVSDTGSVAKQDILSLCHGRYEGYHGYLRFGTFKLKRLIYQPEGVEDDQWILNRPTDDDGPSHRLQTLTTFDQISIYPDAGEKPPKWTPSQAVSKFVTTGCTVASSVDGDDSYVEFDTLFTAFDRWLTLNCLDIPAFDDSTADNMRKGKFGELVQSAVPVEKKQIRTGDGRARVITPIKLTEEATQLLDSA